MVWVRLKVRKKIEIHGVMVVHVKGDWIDVGKQTANLWIGRNDAEAIKFDVGTFNRDGDAGVLLLDHADVGRQVLTDIGEDSIAVQEGEPRLPWDKTLLWNPEVALPKRWLTTGMLLLDTFEVAVPLLPYEQMAIGMGTPSDRERTQELVGDLRVPVYNPAFLFVRRNAKTEYLMNCWQEERVDGPDRRLSLLRAVFRAKPLILPLPCTWTDDRAEFDEGRK